MRAFSRVLTDVLASAGVIAAIVGWPAAAGSVTRRAAPRPPVVVELFTAQGCASCNGVDDWFDRLADRPGIIALEWAVDYWDYLGWKDTFAQPEFADRQRAYDRRLGPRDVYTPQVVVDGAAEAPGDQVDDIESLIRLARRGTRPGPRIEIGSGHVAIGSGQAVKGGGEIWLMRFDPRRQTVEIKDGDNRGKTLERRNVVRQLTRLGGWTGAAERFALPAALEPGLVTVVLVQGRRGGAILAARQGPQAGPPAKTE